MTKTTTITDDIKALTRKALIEAGFHRNNDDDDAANLLCDLAESIKLASETYVSELTALVSRRGFGTFRKDEAGCRSCGRPMTNWDLNQQLMECVQCRSNTITAEEDAARCSDEREAEARNEAVLGGYEFDGNEPTPRTEQEIEEADAKALRAWHLTGSHDPASEDYAEDFLDSDEDMNF